MNNEIGRTDEPADAEHELDEGDTVAHADEENVIHVNDKDDEVEVPR